MKINLVNFLVIITSSFILSSCNSSSPDSAKDLSSSFNEQKRDAKIVEVVTKENISRDLLISNKGIGLAELGMTFGDFKKTLGTEANFKVVSPFMVDLDAIAVSQSREIQYYIVYPNGTKLKDSDVIELLLTDNPNYRTAEGVGVGTTIKEAQAIYGQATLSYNTQSESREMVIFANYPAKNIVFMPERNSDDFAGIYPSSSDEHHETSAFDDSAMIGAIFVGR